MDNGHKWTQMDLSGPEWTNGQYGVFVYLFVFSTLKRRLLTFYEVSVDTLWCDLLQ